MTGTELIDCYEQVWIADFEYRRPDRSNDRPIVHCLAARELHSGRTISLWAGELAQLVRPPYPIGPGSLFLSYSLEAELTCHLALNWPLPERCLDLLAEFRQLTSGSDWREGEKSKHQLIHALTYFGLNPFDAIEKEAMRAVAVRGGPFSSEERRALQDYCLHDVAAEVEVLKAMAPRFNGLHALQRGRYLKTIALRSHLGIPLDGEILDELTCQRDGLIHAFIDNVNDDFDVYRDTTLKNDLLEALVSRLQLPWPRLEAGCLNKQDETWREMTDLFPILQPLNECRKGIGLLKNNKLGVGQDGRSRPTIHPIATATGRDKWAANEFVFAQPGFFRGLVSPEPGRFVAYLDYVAQEFLVAAARSGDPAMLAAYRADDVYIAFGQQAGKLPSNATRESHAKERKTFKTCVLGMQYLISRYGLGRQLNIQWDYADDLIAIYKRTYPRFWLWVQATIDKAVLNGFQETLLGSRTQIRDGVVKRKGKECRLFNFRSAANHPVQGCAADVTRTACCLIAEAGINLLASVHDATLIEGPVYRMEEITTQAKQLMVEANRQVVGPYDVKVSCQTVTYPGRLLDRDTVRKWNWLCDRLGRPEARYGEPNRVQVATG
jgi:hypothetical protein